MNGIGAGLGALGFWGFIAAIVVAGIWYAIRQKEAQHETLRHMIDSGQAIDPALMDKLLSATGGSSKSVDRDLKIAGLIVLSLGPGLAIFGILIGQGAEEWLLPILGVAALVGFIGLGLLVASRAVNRMYKENDTSPPGQS